MRFTLLINQQFAIDHGINLQQAALFALLYELPNWAKHIDYGDHRYYLACKSKIIEELPLLTDKPDTIYRLARALRERELIDMMVVNNLNYYRITDKGKAWNGAQGRKKIRPSEKNPSRVGKKSDLGSEKNPTYKRTSHKSTRDEEAAATAAACPVSELVDMYRKTFPDKRQPLVITEERERIITEGWKKASAAVSVKTGKTPYTDTESGLDFWRNAMSYARTNAKFCMQKQNNFSIDWLFSNNNVFDIVEDQYSDLYDGPKGVR